jgi:hypothetical protein
MAVIDLIKAIKADTTNNAVALAELTPGDSFVLRGDGTNSGAIAFTDSTNTYETLLGSGEPTTNMRLNLPSDAGGANYLIQTDGGGNLSFETDIIVNTITVNGSTSFAGDTNHAADVVPTVTSTYNVGSNALRWANIFADNVNAPNATIGDITIGLTTANTIDTISSDLIIHAITNETIIDTNLTVTGDFIVNGTTTTVNSTTVTIDDPIFTLGGDTAPVSDDAKDRGIEYRWHDGTSAKIGFFGYDNSVQAFTFIPDATNTAEVFSGTLGNVIFNGITGASGNITATFDVGGESNLDSLKVTNNATVYNHFEVAGNTTLNNNLSVGGQTTIGDSSTDLIIVNSKIDSNLVPNGDLVYELGTINDRWKLIYAEALQTTSTIIGDIKIGVSTSNEIDTITGDLILDSATGNVVIDDNLRVVGLTPTRVVYVGASNELVDSANMTFDGTTLNAAAIQVDNISIDGDTITSSAANLNLAQDVVIAGNLTVTGTTSTVNSTTVTVIDPVISIGTNAADDNLDRGIEFLWHDGASAKTGFFGWDDSAQAFTVISDATNASEVFSGVAGNVQFNEGNFTGILTVTGNTTLYAHAEVAGNTTLNNNLSVGGSTTVSTLDSTGLITADSLSVTNNVNVTGTLETTGIVNLFGDTNIGNNSFDTLTVTATIDSDVLPNGNNTRSIGNSLFRWNTVYATTFDGTATSSYYADLAENYFADKDYEPGTVMVFGGNMEITESTKMNDTRVAGVISTDPAHLMNTKMYGDTVFPLALQGRVPCNVIGPVQKGDIIVTSSVPGYGMVNNTATAGTIIGKAVGDKKTQDKGTVEVVVGRT